MVRRSDFTFVRNFTMWKNWIEPLSTENTKSQNFLLPHTFRWWIGIPYWIPAPHWEETAGRSSFTKEETIRGTPKGKNSYPGRMDHRKSSFEAFFKERLSNDPGSIRYNHSSSTIGKGRLRSFDSRGKIYLRNARTFQIPRLRGMVGGNDRQTHSVRCHRVSKGHFKGMEGKLWFLTEVESWPCL